MEEYFITRLFLQKGLAFIYLIAFLIIVNQYTALVGKRGILPLENIVRYLKFRRTPSLFVFHSSDIFLRITGWTGVMLSVAALIGISEQYGLFVSASTWFCLWALYQSFVNVGQIFYGYGWEILLLEAGFLAIFLGPADVAPPILTVWLYRWVLFRMMFGAGMIKIRCDPCWRNLTSMTFHYETQPLPGPLSRFFHRLPVFIHRFSVIFNHFIELIVPFFFFWPGKVAAVAGGFTVLFQVLLLLSGNLSWLNCITIVLCFSCFSDALYSAVFPFLHGHALASSMFLTVLSVLLTGLITYLSIKPVKNLCSRNQAMNQSYDPFNLVNTYGAFGSMIRLRKEIIIEGCSDPVITEKSMWLPYEFKGKPGDVKRRPSQVTPYHYKIDWQMWFAAMSSFEHHSWFIPFLQRLLEGASEVTSLLRVNPFPDAPPVYIRAELYEYRFAPPKNKDGVFWTRKRIGTYVPPLHLVKR